MWVTDRYYHNKNIFNPETENQPIFLGPTLFQFTKDDKKFSRLAVELFDTDPEQINPKTTETDME